MHYCQRMTRDRPSVTTSVTTRAAWVTENEKRIYEAIADVGKAKSNAELVPKAR